MPDVREPLINISIEKVAYTNGDTFEGELKNNKPNGLGLMIKKNGDQLEGTWKGG